MIAIPSHYRQTFQSGGYIPVVFVYAITVCCIGIYTRPIGFLSEFWPANAALLGLFVRFPRLSTLRTWFAAFLGFVVADLLNKNSVDKALALALANFMGIVLGYLCLRLLGTGAQRLSHGMAVAFFFVAAVVAAGGAALAGAAVSVWLGHAEYRHAFQLWFSSELANYVTITPMILTIPQMLREHINASMSRPTFRITIGSGSARSDYLQ